MSSSSTSSPCSPSSSPSSMWADLPTDILELVLGSLRSSFDRLRFGAVCRSWRYVAAAFKENTGRRCVGGVTAWPILTFLDPEDGGMGAAEAADDDVDGAAVAEAAPGVTRCFYGLSEDRVYRLKVPCESRQWRCFGSSHGWLGMLDLRAQPFLFNPISGARVDLPSLATLTRLIVSVERREEDGATVYLYQDPFALEDSDDGLPYPFTGKQIRDIFIRRLALSSSPLDDSNACVVMTTVSEYRLPVYARPGGDSWAEVPGLPSGAKVFRDIIYHDRRFHALAIAGETVAIDFNEGPSSGAHRVQPPTVETIVPRPPPAYYHWSDDGTYLVALPTGEIVRVTKYVDGLDDYGTDSYKTEEFEVHKLVGGGVGGEAGAAGGGEWVEVDYIGDCCLFLGLNQSMSLPASVVLGTHRTNCIFFTDDVCDPYTAERKSIVGLDFGIFDFEEETVEQFCRIDARRVIPPPMWLTPSL